MKTTILTSFVAIALFSTTTIANVIPNSATTGDSDALPTAFSPASSNHYDTITSLEEQGDGAANRVPASEVLKGIPMARSPKVEPRGFFSNALNSSPTQNRRDATDSLNADEAAASRFRHLQPFSLLT
ncbi:hypothetical protein GALMADRAFT_1162671 [Galerina marginata CBS 339.88]|uniref:RxLR effector protein n=1 Tax=Galerina marginata (strain CBS 339.88) TaxID=685588 RepID=A0A067S8R2_GALM3|nr:hypothetical protein GALMADRAFT_1162671 [Galerina marginata CBS 339.88]